MSVNLTFKSLLKALILIFTCVLWLTITFRGFTGFFIKIIVKCLTFSNDNV